MVYCNKSNAIRYGNFFEYFLSQWIGKFTAFIEQSFCKKWTILDLFRMNLKRHRCAFWNAFWRLLVFLTAKMRSIRRKQLRCIKSRMTILSMIVQKKSVSKENVSTLLWVCKSSFLNSFCNITRWMREGLFLCALHPNASTHRSYWKWKRQRAISFFLTSEVK